MASASRKSIFTKSAPSAASRHRRLRDCPRSLGRLKNSRAAPSRSAAAPSNASTASCRSRRRRLRNCSGCAVASGADKVGAHDADRSRDPDEHRDGVCGHADDSDRQDRPCAGSKDSWSSPICCASFWGEPSRVSGRVTSPTRSGILEMNLDDVPGEVWLLLRAAFAAGALLTY